VIEGRTADLYDLHQVAAYQQKIAADSGLEIAIDYEGRKFGPWWNPPFYAWLFAPLALLPYSQALAVWTAVNLAAGVGAVIILTKLLVPVWVENDSRGRPIDWRTTGLVPFALLLSMPFVQAVSHGQNTLGSLLLLSLVAACWRNKRAILAGGFCAMMAYKPQLAAVVAVALVLSLGIRAVAGMMLVGSVIVLVTQFTMPGVLVHYLHQMPSNLRYMQIEHEYLWERHATLAGFWRLLLQGRTAGEWLFSTRALHGVSLLLVGGLLLRALWSHRHPVETVDDCWVRTTQRTWRDRMIAATICAAPLLMPFYFDYDLLLLAVPATLLAAEALVRPIDPQPADKWLVRSWIALYAWMLVNPGMANLTHVNLTVVLLTATSIQMTRRATRPDVKRQQHAPLPVPTPSPLAKAA
jgi:hypothetical protein